MIRTATPIAQDLVFVGGGHAHALVLASWSMDPLPGARLTLVTPDPTTPYTGMLPGVVAGHYRPEEHEIDLVRLARRSSARLILDRAVNIDPEAKTVTLGSGRMLAYDILSLDIGASSEPVALAGSGYAPVKPFGVFLPALATFLADVEAGRAAPRAAILGGGLGGVELAFALAHRLRDWPGREISVLSRNDQTPPGLNPKLWRRILAAAPALGVEIIDRFDAISADNGVVDARDGRRVEADLILAAAGARAAPWLRETGLELDERGFVAIEPTLTVAGRWDVFAVGDTASMAFAPRPKAGVFAVRQAPVLGWNLRQALIEGGPHALKRYRRYRPQRDYLKLVSLGARNAIAEKNRVMASGSRVWRLKDRIDRAFMRKFEPQAMVGEAPPKVAAAGALARREPLCGGCGAKIGAEALDTALAASLVAPRHPETVRGPGDDAALLRRAGGDLTAVTIDQLRAFTNDSTLFAEITAQHALSDIWAMGGEPSAALVAITLPPATPRMQSRMTAELLEGVRRALHETSADLIGGHTSEGLEPSLTIAALGRVSAATAAQLSGAQPGDALILTKPLGVGVLLAGEMRQAAPGRAAAAAFETMRLSNAAAARILIQNGARAMTDVTGFGLLGHLARLLPETLGAEIALHDALFLEGAIDLAAAGLRSSLYTSNARMLDICETRDVDAAQLDLLVDPQTSGGLLAAAPMSQAQDILRQLAATSPGAVVLGHVVEPSDTSAHRFRFAKEPA